MGPKRPSFPPPARASTPTRDLSATADPANPPATPGPNMTTSSDSVMSGHTVTVPPSPGLQNLMHAHPFGHLSSAPGTLANPARKSHGKHANDRTGAGVKKSRTRAKAKTAVDKLVDATVGATAALSISTVHKPFRFMELPGEIRNLIYRYAFESPKQALLVHRPRMASLRPRTRIDRQRALESDIKDRELGRELSLVKNRRPRPPPKNQVQRETNRPYWGLTQVNSQIRQEFRPLYMHKQEIGMDVNDIVKYLQTFYSTAPAEFAKLMPGSRRRDMPFNGNLTIAVGDKITVSERSNGGVEVVPLLDIWANSVKIEAGFGRYQRHYYRPEVDGEAKDLYRLFGRRVLPSRQCSAMNTAWRSILRARALASVTLHRKPAHRIVDFSSLIPGTPEYAQALRFVPFPVPTTPYRISINYRPFIHILFRKETAEPWMTEFVSPIPKSPIDWLAAHGFDNMEYFEIKVGIAPAGVDRRAK